MYEFRIVCRNCKDKVDCNLDGHIKQYKGKCYIHSIAKRINKKPYNIFKAREKFYESLLIMPEDWLDDKCLKEKWASMTESKKIQDMRSLIFHGKTLIALSDDEIKIIIAIFNTIWDMWRTDNQVHCIKCGKIIENNKMHNRLFCENCKNHREKRENHVQIRICSDCGCEFVVDNNNRRQYRCDCCQLKADKENARNRKRRQREKMSRFLNERFKK